MQNTVTNKYLEEVERAISEVPSLEDRKAYIEELDERHFEEFGKHLPAYLLEMLGTWLLAETYSDKRTNKVSVEEFPVLSESQLLRRNRKTVNFDNEGSLDVLNYHLRNNSSTSRRDTEAKKGAVEGVVVA